MIMIASYYYNYYIDGLIALWKSGFSNAEWIAALSTN